MEIRLANKDDKKQVKDIWKYCFREPDEYVDFYFDNQYDEKNNLVVADGDKILSSVQLNQYRLKMRGDVFDTSYVVGVSTLPEFRGKGMMKNLMVKMLDEMVSRGQEIAILMPIDTRLYRRFGFENCYDMIENSVELVNLSDFRIEGDFRKADEGNIKDLEEVYRNSLKTSNGYVVRDDSYFKRYIKEMEIEGGYIYINYIDDKPVSYISYLFEDGKLFIVEMYCTDTKSLKSLLGFIYSHNTQVKSAVMLESVTSKTRFEIPNSKFVKTEVKQFMMGRIIDFRKYIERFFESEYLEKRIERFGKIIDRESVSLRVTDDYIGRNNLTVKFDFIDRNLVYTFSESDDFDVSVDINTLATLVFGYRNVYEIEKFDLLSENQKLMIDIMFPKMLNHINEYS